MHALSLVPCGHTSCLSCLQSWFGALPSSAQEGEPVIPVSRRKKTCPLCRSIVTQRPVGVFLIRDFSHHVETMLSVHEGRPPAVTQQEANADVDPWEGIFPAFANRAADGAIVDNEDGGVRRCPTCTWEIFGGMCEGCGREFDESDGEFDEDGERYFMPPIDDAPVYDWLLPVSRAWYAGFGDYDEDEYDTPDEYDMDVECDFIDDEEPEVGSREWVFDLLCLEDVLNSTCSSTPEYDTPAEEDNPCRVSFFRDGEQEVGSREWVFVLLYLEDVLNSIFRSTPAYDTPAEEDTPCRLSFFGDGEPEVGSREWVFDFLYLEDVLNSTCSSTPACEAYEDAQSDHSHSPSQNSDYSGNSDRRRRQSVELVDGLLYTGPNTEPEDWINHSDSEDDRDVFLRAPHRNRHHFISSDDEDEHLADVSLWFIVML